MVEDEKSAEQPAEQSAEGNVCTTCGSPHGGKKFCIICVLIVAVAVYVIVTMLL